MPVHASDGRPISARICAEALYGAVVAARQAPSAGNAQPWRWRLSGRDLDLFVEARPAADGEDADERLSIVGCGAALQHARLALAAHGWRATVTRQPVGADPRHLARLHIDAATGVSRQAVDAAHSVGLRHTDPRPVTGEPLSPPDLRELRTAVEVEGGRLHLLRPDEILRLVLAADPAGGGPDETQWYDELGRWAGRGRLNAADRRVPRQPHARPRAATFAVLYGPGDERLDWLRAGEALSAAWLVATRRQVSVLPFSAPVERPAARAPLVRLFDGHGHPYLVVRLGRQSDPAYAPSSTRLPVDQILQGGTSELGVASR
jgi:nitroreductase